MFLLDYFPRAGPGLWPPRPFQRLPRRQVQRKRQGAGNGGMIQAAALARVALCMTHGVPPCAACTQRGAEHSYRHAAQAHMAARALQAWLQPAEPAGLSDTALGPLQDQKGLRRLQPLGKCACGQLCSRSSSPE